MKSTSYEIYFLNKIKVRETLFTEMIILNQELN